MCQNIQSIHRSILHITENVAGAMGSVILTFYDHKTKKRCLCKSKMISDDAVQVLSSGGTLKLENTDQDML